MFFLKFIHSALILGLVYSVNSARAESLTLEQALGIAEERSPTIRQARHNLEINRRNLQAQKAALKSKFFLTLTPYQFSKDRLFNDLVSAYNTQEQTHLGADFVIQQPITRTDGILSIIETIGGGRASSSFSGSVDRQTYNNSLQVRFTQPLFTYNRNTLNLESLELSLENARLSFALQKLQLENQVTRLFLDLYLTKKNLQIAAEELKNATESYAIIRSKVDANISAREELYQADLSQAQSRAHLENTQIQYANALDEFKIHLGLDLDHPIQVQAQLANELVEVDLDHAVDHALEHRMELRQRDIALRNAHQDLIRTAAQNEFKGTLNITYGLTGTEEHFKQIYDSPTRNQQISVSFDIPLFDWGEKGHRMAASRQQLASRQLSAREEGKQIVLDVRRAYRNLKNQRTQLDIAAKNVENARRTYEINLERYRNGDLSSKDISFYQNQLANEQLGEVRALINYRNALLDLKIQTLWDFAQKKSIVNAYENE